MYGLDKRDSQKVGKELSRDAFCFGLHVGLYMDQGLFMTWDGYG